MATTPRTGSRNRADNWTMATTSSVITTTPMTQQRLAAGEVPQGRRRALSSCHGASRTH